MEKARAGLRERSAMRRRYELRLVCRGVLAVGAVLLYSDRPEVFAVLGKGDFFQTFSPLHILWVIWVWEMLMKLYPAGQKLALGAQKQFGCRYMQAEDRPDRRDLESAIRKSEGGARKVFLIWTLLTLAIGAMSAAGWLREKELFLLAVIFYLCDLICVVVWCPFRTFWMKNKCCTTCRIFNWDHLMMFSPFFFLPGAYARSLLIMSLVVFLVWEMAWRQHPERFLEESNRALRCKECTDRICGR